MRTIRSVQTNERRRGGAIVFVTVFLSVIAGLAFSLMVSSLGSVREQRGVREEMKAVFLAEAAASEAFFQLETAGNGAVAAAGDPRPALGGSYWVTSNDLGGGVTQLMATSDTGRSQARVELVVSEVVTNLFAWAAFGDEGLTLDSNARVDSYDSTAGDYDSQEVNGSGSNSYANSDGNVGSNGDVLAQSNTSVYGDAIPGPGSSTTLVGSATVSGSTAPNANLIELPPIEVPPLASVGPLTVSGGDTQTIPSGSHRFDDVSIEGNATLWITGPATIVFDSFELRSNAEMRVDAAAGPVEIYVINDFVMNSNTLVASSTYSPLDISLNLLSDNVINPELEVDLDDVEFESNAMLYGTIYAPNAAIEIDSNFELFGAIVARSLLLDSNSQIHYDEALMQADENAQITYQVLCQRVLK